MVPSMMWIFIRKNQYVRTKNYLQWRVFSYAQVIQVLFLYIIELSLIGNLISYILVLSVGSDKKIYLGELHLR